MHSKLPRMSKGCRARLLKRGEASRDPATAIRFRIVVHASMKHPPAAIARVLFCAVSTVCRTIETFLKEGEQGLIDGRSANGRRIADAVFDDKLVEVLAHAPQRFGWDRTTWTRELLCATLAEQGQPKVSVSTMGRALRRVGAALRRPKPVVACPWPSWKRKSALRQLRKLAAASSIDEPVFYEDEMDIHLNPKIGPDWTLPGQRRLVVTPGKNEKRYAAGAMHAGTGRITWVIGVKKTSALFCDLVAALVASYRRAKRIHLILDNYIVHTSKITRRFIEKLGAKVVLHFLPPYCPDDNRIERVWLDLHANVTRNHRYRSIDEVVAAVVRYLDSRNADGPNLATLRCAA